MDNYTILVSYCRKEAQHGGTLIFIRSDIIDEHQFKPLASYDHLLVEREFEFSVCVSMKLRMYVVCIYRPPSCSEQVFIERLYILLELLNPGFVIVLTGDLNINFANKDHIYTIELINLLNSFNLRMHVKESTRVSQSSSTIIDYVCTRDEEGSCECAVTNPGLSDHEAVLFSISLGRSGGQTAGARKQGRIFSRHNFTCFMQQCQNTDWRDPTNHFTLSYFHSSLTTIFEKCFPLRNLKIKTKKPWVTRGIATASKNLRSLHTIRKFFINNTFFISYFNNYRKIYRRVVELSKKKHFQARLALSSNRQRECWNIVGQLRGRTKKGNSGHSLEPEVLNDYFCNVSRSSVESAINPLDFLNDRCPDSFFLTPTNQYELKQVLGELKNKTSSGWDGISLKILRHLPDCTLFALSEAINHSFLTGTFPACLKVSRVVPIPKCDDVNSPEHFRPIALLPTLSKIVEKLVKNRVTSFLESKKILNFNQFGFQSKKNTTDAVFHFLAELYIHLNEGDSAAAVFCDLSKAFDCVNHGVLLQKLEHYGFRGGSLLWFESYLSCRKQSVRVGNFDSGLKCNLSGVPQGSVLGPILFLLYINDIVNTKIKGLITLFADDTTILWTHPNRDILMRVINCDIQHIKDWCDCNLLSFNVSKTNIMHFNYCMPEPVILNNNEITCSDVYKFLGILIDKNLTFKHHITNLLGKLSSGCYALSIVSKNLDFATARMAYFALIESHLRYGIVFWGCAGQGLFNSVFVLQKRAVRRMCGVHSRESCKPLFKKHRLLTLPSLFILETSCLLHKRTRHLALTINNTRQRGCLPTPIPHSALIKNSIIYNARKIYNHLPKTLRESNSFAVFKRKLGDVLLNRAYYTVDEFLEDRI